MNKIKKSRILDKYFKHVKRDLFGNKGQTYKLWDSVRIFPLQRSPSLKVLLKKVYKLYASMKSFSTRKLLRKRKTYVCDFL